MKLRNGAEPKRPNSYGWFSLHYAGCQGNTWMLALLLQPGPEFNTATLNMSKLFSRPIEGVNFPAGTTLLVLATFFSSMESVEMLLKAKVDHSDK